MIAVVALVGHAAVWLALMWWATARPSTSLRRMWVLITIGLTALGATIGVLAVTT